MTNVSNNATYASNCMMEFKAIFHVSGILLAILIIIFNIFVIIVLIKYKKLLKLPANHILLSLATNDCLSGFLLVLHNFPYFYLHVNGCNELTEVLNPFYFAVASLITQLLLISSVFHLIMLSTERFITLYYALRCLQIITTKRVALSILFSWIIALIATSCKLIWYLPYLYYNKTDTFEILDRYYFISVTIMFAILPTIVLMLQYIYLSVLVREMALRSIYRRRDKEKRTLIIYCVMLVCFLVLCYPYLIMKLMLLSDPSSYQTISAELFECMFLVRFSVSLINPILYSLMKLDIRKALVECFGKYCKSSTKRNNRLHSDAPELSSRQIEATCV